MRGVGTMKRTLVHRGGVWYACGKPCKSLRAAMEALARK